MTSIIKVDQIEKTDGSSFGFGKVLQVEQTLKTDTQVITSTSFIDVMTATITPSKTTSKIMVELSVNISGFGHFDLKLQADGADICVGDAAGNRVRSTNHGYRHSNFNTTYDQGTVSIKFLHSPSTTSSVTYKLVAGSPYSSSYYVTVNRSYHDADYNYEGRTASTLTLTEIAG